MEEGAADALNDPQQQEEQRRSSSHRKKKSKHRSKEKKKGHKECTVHEEESIENEPPPVLAGAASLPSNKTLKRSGKDDDSSFTNLLATFSDQNDSVPPKGMIEILCFLLFPLSIISHSSFRHHHSMHRYPSRHSIDRESKASDISEQ
jgi:hypothetical protein